MDTLVIYMTKHGATEKASNILKEHLEEHTEIVNLKTSKPDLDKYKSVIIGGSIHAGKLQSKLQRYIRNNQDTLLKKKLGLFICCMDKEREQEEFDNNYPAVLRNHSSAKGLFGGEFNIERMNSIEKAIVKKVGGVTESISTLDSKAISEFAARFRKNSTVFA